MMKTLTKKTMNYTNMKKAVLDQIILWIVLFIAFVGFLFFVIEYSNAVKVIDNTDAAADYIARMAALDRSEDDIVAALNNLILEDFFQDATVGTSAADAGLFCEENTAISDYQVVVDVRTTLENNFIANSEIHSRTAVFNERSEFRTECSITLTIN